MTDEAVANTTERPILMKGWTVRAILEGRKTQTRRVIKPQAHHYVGDVLGQPVIYPCHDRTDMGDPDHAIKIPYQPGDELWVRETWGVHLAWDDHKPSDLDENTQVYYFADDPYYPVIGKTRPSIFMPRWASRIKLRVDDVRVERVQKISGHDVYHEGVTKEQVAQERTGSGDIMAHRRCFANLWDEINAKRDGGVYAWDENPWVWVIEFTH